LVSTGYVHGRKPEDADTQTKFSGHSYFLDSQGIYDITTGSIAKLLEWHDMQQLDSRFIFVKEKYYNILMEIEL
jgi:hypothetical protein